MVLLQLRTDNTTNTTLAKFDSLYDNAYIQFSNVNNNLYLSGITGNYFKIYNPNNTNDDGLSYSSNQLNVKSHNTQIIKYNSIYSTFPNDFTPLNNFQFNEYNVANPFGFANCFDMNSSTFWKSDTIYSTTFDGYINTTNVANFDPYNFQNSGSRGYWVKIKFPYQVIPIGIYFSSLIGANTPSFFDVFVSNDDITWTKILVVNSTSSGNEFFFRQNTTLYLYVAIVITRINFNPTINDILQSFSVNEVRIYTMPILHLDNNLKITNNNIINLNTISANRIVLNNSIITSANDLSSYIIAQAVQQMVDLYNIYWKNNGTTGYLNSNIVNKIAINTNVANSTLDIYGDIGFKQRSLYTSFTITNRGGVFDIPSSYVYIGKIIFTNNTINYFKLSLILFELNKYYFQTININGYSAFSSNLNIYWDTVYDNTYVTERIIDINYKIDTSVINKTSILFYCKYNPILNITTAVAPSDLVTDYINNTTYIDLINTSSMNNVEFVVRNSINNTNNSDSDLYSNAYLISSTSLNKNSNSIININANKITTNDFTANKIKLNNSSFITSNFLVLDGNMNITDSGISSNSLSIISKLPQVSNKIIGTNNNGILSYLDVSSLLLSNINYHTNINNKILISSNNYYEGFIINKNNLSNLNNINITPNSIVIIDSNNNFTTTMSVSISNISNLLNLFNFSTNKNYVNVSSDLSMSNLNIGNTHIITSNYKFNRIVVNNREIADDIFKLVAKVPDYNTIVTNKIKDYISPADELLLPATQPITYTVSFNNNTSISLGINKYDSNINDNRQPYNIFDKSLDSYWLSQANFLNYNTTSYGAIKTLNNDPLLTTACGAYIIFNFGYDFVLNYYVIYTNYPDLTNSIRDFKVFAYNNKNEIWDLIDQKTGIFMNNNLIPNVFTLNKPNFNTYSKYAICITNTHNQSTIYYSRVNINGVDFFGYPIKANFLASPNLVTYNNENAPVLMGNNNVGVKNIDPYCPLSIGNDIPSNPQNSMININHLMPITNNNELPIMTLTRHSLDSNIKGIKATHYLNSWYNSNTNYTIKLTHSNITNEKIVFSMNSSGNIGIGGYPNSDLINNNGLSFYDNNSKFINIYSPNITSSYSLVLPPYQGISNNSLFVTEVRNNNNIILGFDDPLNQILKRPIVNFNSIGLNSNNAIISIQTSNDTCNYSLFMPPRLGSNNMTFLIDKVVNNSNIYFKFGNPVSNLISTSFIKIGDETITTRAESNMTVQIAGRCLIGYSNFTVSNISSNYFSNNALVVVGKMYVTNDVAQDSDIAYKYNIRPIEDPLGKINKINGYTFNRNDTDDNNRYSGLIAQEVLKVMPEVITVKPDGKYRIIYTNLAGLFVETIKKLDKKTDYINFKLNCFISIVVGIGFVYLYSKR